MRFSSASSLTKPPGFKRSGSHSASSPDVRNGETRHKVSSGGMVKQTPAGAAAGEQDGWPSTRLQLR